MVKQYNLKDFNGLYLKYEPSVAITELNFRNQLIEDHDFYPINSKNLNLYSFKNAAYESDKFTGSNLAVKANSTLNYSQFTKKDSLTINENYTNEFYLYFRYYGNTIPYVADGNLSLANSVDYRQLQVKFEVQLGSATFPCEVVNIETNPGSYNNMGVLFQYNITTNTYTKKVDFSGLNGSYPYSQMIEYTGNTGVLFGTTPGGGAYNCGIIFEYDTNTNMLTKRADFDGTALGSEPVGSLVYHTTNGKMYGLTRSGGANDAGVLYEYDPTTYTITNKVNFDSVYGTTGSTGSHPMGSLAIEPFGSYRLCGTTFEGGLMQYGTFFRYNPSGSVFTKIFDFSGTTNGACPMAGLIFYNGIMCGTTYMGGASDKGTFYTVDVNGTDTYTKIADFKGTSLGKLPYGELTIDSYGDYLYGTTLLGGTIDKGVLFKYDLTSVTKVADFVSVTNTPQGVVFGSDGNLYGMTPENGIPSNSVGLIYNMLKSWDFAFAETIYDFDGINGGLPQGSLTAPSFDSNNMYGLTSSGGYSDGTTYNPSIINPWNGTSGIAINNNGDGILLGYGGTDATIFEDYKTKSNKYNFRVKLKLPNTQEKCLGSKDYKLNIKYYNKNGTVERMSKTISYQKWIDLTPPPGY